MRWIIVCVMLILAVPAWAAKKKNKPVQPPPVTQTQESEPIESSLWNQKMCPKGIEDWKTLITLNPYDSEGRCFNYIGRLIQLLNKNQALFSLMTDSAPFALVDFGKESVQIGPYTGIVKGKGAYSYVTVSGRENIIFSFVTVPKSKGREAWDKKRSLEKASEEERQRTEKRAKAEEEWKKEVDNSKDPKLIAQPFIFIEPSTGLMWTRNGNIAEKKMTGKEALDWVKTLNYAGYNDWRLPTKKELDHFMYGNNLDGFFNITDASAIFLTSTRYNDYSDIFSTYDYRWSRWESIGPISHGFVWPVRDVNVPVGQK